MNDLNKKPDTGAEEVYNHLMKAVGKEYLFRVRFDDYNVQNLDKALTVSSISNIATPSKRIRTAPPCTRQLSFSASDKSTPTVANQSGPTNSGICSQASSCTDLCPHPPSTPNTAGADASGSRFRAGVMTAVSFRLASHFPNTKVTRPIYPLGEQP